MSEKYIYGDLTKKIIRCFYNVHDELGYGFVEKVYENALILEFENNGIKAENQKEIKVFYKNDVVGNYKADIIVEGKIIIEIKALKRLINLHEVQLVNYLKATRVQIGNLYTIISKTSNVLANFY